MSDKPIIQKIIVGGIVIKDNKVLIIQRSADEESYPNLWELPSGKREPLESSDIAITREVKEETNLNVKVIKPVSIFEFKNEKPTEIRDSTQINFLVEYVSGEVKLSSEHQNSTWITKDELEEYKVSEETKGVIKKAFENINQTPKFIVNVEAAIYKDDKWLMIMRSKKETHAGGTLSMVCGKIDYEDDLKDTLENGIKREVKEEVGIQISDIMKYIQSTMFVSALGNHIIDIVLLCKYESGEPVTKAKDEVDSVSWMTLEEIKNHENTPPWILQSMQKAEKTRKTVK